MEKFVSTTRGVWDETFIYGAGNKDDNRIFYKWRESASSFPNVFH